MTKIHENHGMIFKRTVNNIQLTKKAEKDFLNLPKETRDRISKVITSLESDFPPTNTKKLKTPFDGYRIRVGDYRILLTVEEKQIVIYSIKHRKDAYKF